VQSHIDWFDVAAVVNYGDLSVDLATIRRAVLKRERYVLLADGSLGLVSHELAQRLAPLFAMGQTHDATIRYATAQVGVVEQIVQEASMASVDSAFEERRARLRLFEHIEPQPLPDGFRGSLRNYQKAGYDWLHFLNTYGFGGCLADDMGVGKTIQTLAFIQSMRERAPQANAILIVMPRSIVYNWQREASRFTPNLRLLTHIDQGRSKDTATFAQYDVILTTYGTMLRDIDMLTSYRFQYVILDESQAVKNPSAETARAVRRLQTERRLSLTGTPIENSAVELWSQFAFLNPGLLGSAETFRETFTREGEGRDEALKLLRRLTFPFILRRTKDQVAPDLPSRTERVLMNEMEPEQRRLYNAQRDHYRALLLGLIDSAGPQQTRVKMLEGLLRLRQICNHPRLIDPNSAGVSGKFESLLATLEALQAAGHRALVFSQFVQMLTLVRAELDARGITYAYLDGRTRDRQSIIDAFQRDNRHAFFLISLRAGGVGLNLTAADYVIHVDPWWNPAVEMQATDRSHRIGQTRPVMVYKMVVRDSVEEKILQLQDRKRELVRQLITPERGGLKTLTRDDVELLFT
jgi:non-specific serine/threonine protein kinase